MKAIVDQRREMYGNTSGGGEKDFWGSIVNKFNVRSSGFYYTREGGTGDTNGGREVGKDGTMEHMNPPLGNPRGAFWDNSDSGTGNSGGSNSLPDPPMQYIGTEFYDNVPTMPRNGRLRDTVPGAGVERWSNGQRDSIIPLYRDNQVFPNHKPGGLSGRSVIIKID